LLEAGELTDLVQPLTASLCTVMFFVRGFVRGVEAKNLRSVLMKMLSGLKGFVGLIYRTPAKMVKGLSSFSRRRMGGAWVIWLGISVFLIALTALFIAVPSLFTEYLSLARCSSARQATSATPAK
jgi:hypothetical protein